MMKIRLACVPLLLAILASLIPIHASPFTDPVSLAASLTPATGVEWPIQLHASQADGHGLTFAITGGPTHGTTSILDAGRGILIYRSTSLYTGPDSFTFTATDNTTSAVSNTATVTITVVNQHTTVNGHLTNPDGTVRAGTAIWDIMTTGVTNDGSLVPAGGRVTQTLDINGFYSVSLFATVTLAPVCYYTLTFQAASTGLTTKIGVYAIPTSSAPLSQAGLDANKQTNTNTADYYSPMAESTGQALITVANNAAAAALAAQAAAETASSTSHIYDLASGPIPGRTSPNQIILAVVSDRTFTLGITGSACSAETAAASQTDFVVTVNGTTKGTLRFASSGTTCSVVSPTSTTVNSGDKVRILGPAIPDTTLANLGFTLKSFTADLNIYDFVGFNQGLLISNRRVMTFPVVRSSTLSITGSTCAADTAATAQTDLGIYVGTSTSNGSLVGTLRFAASGTTCSLVSITSTPLSSGQVVRVIGPASPDITLANIAFTVKGSAP